MTLVYKTDDPLMPPHALTVPLEAMRAVKFAVKWFIFVSDPEVMAVSKFRLTAETVKQATEAITDELNLKALSNRTASVSIEALSAEHAELMTEWLMKQKFIRVELVQSEGQPSMFGKFPTSGPSPNLDLA